MYLQKCKRIHTSCSKLLFVVICYSNHKEDIHLLIRFYSCMYFQDCSVRSHKILISLISETIFMPHWLSFSFLGCYDLYFWHLFVTCDSYLRVTPSSFSFAACFAVTRRSNIHSHPFLKWISEFFHSVKWSIDKGVLKEEILRKILVFPSRMGDVTKSGNSTFFLLQYESMNVRYSSENCSSYTIFISKKIRRTTKTWSLMVLSQSKNQ